MATKHIKAPSLPCFRVECYECKGTGSIPKGEKTIQCWSCRGYGRVATNAEGMCRQCGMNPAEDFLSKKKDRLLTRLFPKPRVCVDCGLLNLARNFEEEHAEDATEEDKKEGLAAGAFWRQFRSAPGPPSQ